MHIPTDSYEDNSFKWNKKIEFDPVLAENFLKINQETIEKFGKSQNSEDIFLFDNYFFGMKNGIILESGASDGLNLSNSYFFVNYANWSAVHIEPDPESFKMLLENRPGEININAAICEKPQKLHYIIGDFGPVNGFYEFMNDAFLFKWHKKYYFDPSLLEDTLIISCVPLPMILKLLNINHVDIWILDVEGAEYSILKGIDFDLFQPSVIVMECDYPERDVRKVSLLEYNDYSCVKAYNNCVCKHKNFVPSRSPFPHESYNIYYDFLSEIYRFEGYE